MPRSIKVKRDCIEQVKQAVKFKGFPSQRALAEELGFALATVNNFLNGRPVDFATFDEISRRLGLEWREIADLDFGVSAETINRSAERSTFPKPKQDESPSYPNGSVPIGSRFYLERTAIAEQIDRELRKPGGLVRIRAPREMGKTSLLLRILDNAKRQGYHTVSLNLVQVDRSTLTDLTQFLRWLCANVARQLEVKPMLDKFWDEDLGSKISCTAYFQDYILREVNTSVIIALDEVNQVFEYPHVAKDFLPLLRSWYEEAKTLPIWQKLCLIVVHSTEIYVPLQLNQSPFNVGLPIQLNCFTVAEVQQLAQRYGFDWQGDEADLLTDLVGGHPALVQIALYQLYQSDTTLAQLLETAATSTGIYASHLQRHWATLQEQSELATALNITINATEPVSLDPTLAYKLSSMGLIKLDNNRATLMCQLYQIYFANRFE